MKKKPEESLTLGRRQFLQASLVGAAAVSVPAGVAAAQSTPDETDDHAAPRCEGGTTRSTPACGCSPSEDAPGPIDLSSAIDTWNEPWVWRPSDWPGQQLPLHVVENQNPGVEVGLGNPGSVIFSYGGNTPGPTIRMRGDEILFVKLRNLLGQNVGETAIGPNPDAGALVPWLGRKVCETAAENPSNGVFPGKPYVNTFCLLEDCSKVSPGTFPDAVAQHIPAERRADFCLGEHTNGLHATHTTNLHTHGLHVRPDRNPNGTHSDNVILRVMPQQDLIRREQNAESPSCQFLRNPEEIYFQRDDETAGEADYEFRLGDVMGDPDQPHPPGTHWYHPHCHGATHNQVASGMAGFLIIEGDVDAAVNRFFTGEDTPDPTEKTGDYDYRERLMFMQRVNALNISSDPNSPRPSIRRPTVLPLVNGSNDPALIRMRPGAVERWRVINGSVDGRGYKHFMVVEGQYEVVDVEVDQLPDGEIEPLGGAEPPCDTERPNRQRTTRKIINRLCKIESDGSARCVGFSDLDPADGGPKQPLYQFAFDGITLVDAEGHYTIKDLSTQRAGTANPLAAPLTGNPGPNVCLLRNLENVFTDAESIRNTWVRPNEVYLGPANRTDVFFQAPRAGKSKVYTVLAKAALIHADTPLQSLQQGIHKRQSAGPGQPDPEILAGPTDIVLAHIVVDGEPVSASFDLEALRGALPKAPAYLQPVADDELDLTAPERRARTITGNQPVYRTRTIRYSGVGSQGFPLVVAPAEETGKAANAGLERLAWAPCPEEQSPTQVFMSPNIKTMAINGRKFSPKDPKRPKAYVIIDEATEGGHAAEEWAIFNESPTLWGNVETSRRTDGEPEGDPRSPEYKQPVYQFGAHFVSYPISRREGFEGFAANTEFQVVTRAIDHPFHQHQNPFWVLRIEIPDADGNLVNILDEPRWQDTVWIPRNGGRVVFRSRFPDFVGTWVNHCHILLHEDNGMMQTVQGTPFADEADYTTATTLARGGFTPPDATNTLYPPPTPADMYRRSLAFVDPNHASGQKFPLPSYFDADENLIEDKIPVPTLEPSDEG